MLRKKEVLTAIGTLGCAMGIGFVMQNSAVAEKRYGTPIAAAPLTTIPELKSAVMDDTLLDVTGITLTSAEIELEGPSPDTQIEVGTAPVFEDVLPESDLPQTTDISACDIDAKVQPVAAAMVDLSMTAPCLPNEHVTVHHNGMVFTETTSDTGTLDLRIPALTQDATFIIAFSSGEGAVATTTVDELSEFDRAVLQWKGNAGFEIHAREFGAEYGTQGHRWADAPGDLASVVGGASGVLTRHGHDGAAEPLLAEVYTFPKNINGRSGDVILTVEAEVTEANCGLEVEAQSLEMQTDGEVRTRNLILPVPSCDSVGSFLVLNNLLQDLKVAAK